jgi:hypothetical protein
VSDSRLIKPVDEVERSRAKVLLTQAVQNLPDRKTLHICAKQSLIEQLTQPRARF